MTVLISAAAAVSALMAAPGAAHADEGPYASFKTQQDCRVAADYYNHAMQERGSKTLRVTRECYYAYGKWWFDARY
ncbi:hypothetical protein ACFWPX_36365 [Nocardia sp. NPDC058518]|uniref:hypothetical protein n=1 Tax=Nocardia sp. NPDC058518 TaxID=3346534 RepID=UPI003665FE86